MSLKTPISTISISSEMLMNSNIQDSKSKLQKYAKIIYDENTRLKNQVEQVLQIAVLDKGKQKLKLKQINVHKLIENSIKGFNVVINERSGKLDVQLNAIQNVITADRMHLTNIVRNLLDNAIKYTPETPHIVIKTENRNNDIVISIQDNGIGINNDHQRHNISKIPSHI